MPGAVGEQDAHEPQPQEQKANGTQRAHDRLAVGWVGAIVAHDPDADTAMPAVLPFADQQAAK